MARGPLKGVSPPAEEEAIARWRDPHVDGAVSFTASPVQRGERGDPGVGAGVYASVLHALGLLGDLDVVADPLRDEVG